MALISVIVPCYNAEAFLAEAVESVLRQTHAEFECIVVNDCSTDNSATVLRDLAAKDDRIKPIYLEANRGASGARNAGLAAARGEWITFLDADDLYYEHRLAMLLALLTETGAQMAFDNQAIADFPGTQVEAYAFSFLRQRTGRIDPEGFFEQATRLNGSLSPGYIKPIVARALLEAHHLVFDTSFPSGEDLLMYSRALIAAGAAATTSEAGYLYRRRGGSLTQSGIDHVNRQASISDEIVRLHGAVLSPRARKALDGRKKLIRAMATISQATADFRRTRNPAVLLRGRYLALIPTVARLMLHNRRMKGGRARVQRVTAQ